MNKQEIINIDLKYRMNQQQTRHNELQYCMKLIQEHDRKMDELKKENSKLQKIIDKFKSRQAVYQQDEMMKL